MSQNYRFAGHFAACATIFIWGTTFISTKVLLKSFAPIEILLFRFLLGFAVLWIAYPHRLTLNNRKQELMFACAGLCGITLYYLLENIALTYSMASNIGVIVSIAPFFTAIAAHIFLEGEKLKSSFILGFVIAITGIILISFPGSGVIKMNFIGDLLAVSASIVWSAYSILTKKISAYGYPTIASTRRIFFYGLLFMLPSCFLFDFQFGLYRFADPVNLLNILFLGLAASALCFVTWSYAVKLLGAVHTSIYIYLVPVITVITSVMILKEKITPLSAFGILLTLLGSLISESRLHFCKERKVMDL